MKFSSQLSRLFIVISGKYPLFSMDQRALNLFNFTLSFNFFIGGVSGLFLNLGLIYVAGQFCSSLIMFTLFTLSRLRKGIGWIDILSNVTVLVAFLFTWFSEGGINGPLFGTATGFFIVFVSTSYSKRNLKIITTAYILTVLTVLILNYYNPQFSIPYPNLKERYFDFFLVFIQTIIPVYLIYVSNQQCYQYEQQLVIEKNNALEHALTTKNKLFAIIGHDLRGPLATLDGMVTMVHNQTLSPLEFTENAKRIQNKTGRLREMLDNLLNWSLSQTETIQINKTNISALPILLSEIATLEEELVEKGIYLEYNLTNKEVLFADADHVRIIFRNLLTNAVRYTQKNGGKITIHANRLVDTYQFIFTNSPIVISSLGTSKATIKSTGLGLILSKEFALQNGGSLETIILDELSYKATLLLQIGKL